MIKTILVAASGGKGDSSTFQTALTLARRLTAHLDFYHIWMTPDDAAALQPHVDFAQGPALKDALERLQRDAEARSAAATRLFREFCSQNKLPVVEPKGRVVEVSVSWLEEKGDALRGLTTQARHHDLAVIGPPDHENGLRRDLAGQLLLSCGRPIVIAPTTPRTKETGIVVVGWKETPQAARALTAAMPLLALSPRVILTSVEDSGAAHRRSLEDIARQLARQGIAAEAQSIGAEGRSVAERLVSAAQSADADFLVVGVYGHSRIRELTFGGVTQSLLAGVNVPLFLMH